MGRNASCGDGLSTLKHLAHFRPGILVIDANRLEEELKALLVGDTLRG